MEAGRIWWESGEDQPSPRANKRTEASGDGTQLCGWPKPLARLISSALERALGHPAQGAGNDLCMGPQGSISACLLCGSRFGLTEVGSFLPDMLSSLIACAVCFLCLTLE